MTFLAYLTYKVHLADKKEKKQIPKKDDRSATMQDYCATYCQFIMLMLEHGHLLKLLKSEILKGMLVFFGNFCRIKETHH